MPSTLDPTMVNGSVRRRRDASARIRTKASCGARLFDVVEFRSTTPKGLLEVAS
jgi:hypothetical protein